MNIDLMKKHLSDAESALQGICSTEEAIKARRSVQAALDELSKKRTDKQVISGYHRPVCGTCHCELYPETNGVGLLDIASYGPYEIYDADLWKCPKCGMTVIGGFALNPIAAICEEESFTRIIASYKAKGKLIENSG